MQLRCLDLLQPIIGLTIFFCGTRVLATGERKESIPLVLLKKLI